MATLLLMCGIGFVGYKVYKFIRSNPEKVNTIGSQVKEMFK